jgi:P4 family phage/plasmid primase-like protien
MPEKASEPDLRENGRESNGPRSQAGLIKGLADAITKHDQFARDAGDRLYRFSGGVYRQYAERYIRQRVKELLEKWGRADKWSSHLASEVAAYICADAPELWERPPLHEINVLNGILNVETRELRDHDSRWRSPVQIPVEYDADARCPEWEKFVGEVFPEDAQDLAFELAADIITPSQSIQKAILLLGEGSNGKSTALRGLVAFVGSTNTSGTSLHKLESDRFAAARLVGKLVNICPDLPSTHLTETSVFKAIVGGDLLHAERKYLDSFEFVPHVRLVFSANHVPRSGDASHAFFRRWLVVPFNRTFEPDEQVPREVLDAKLSDPHELSGVLNRALDVLPRVRREGFTESQTMRDAWEEFKTMTDPVSVWLDKYTVAHADALTPKSVLLQAYNAACDADGRSSMTKTAFGLALKRARPKVSETQRTVNGKPRTWCWQGIGIKNPEPSPPDDDPFSPGAGNAGNGGNGFPLIVSYPESDGSKSTEETNKGNHVTSVTSVTSVEGVHNGGGDTLGNRPSLRRLTTEQVHEYRRLVREGMLPEAAGAAVRGEEWR